MDGYGEQSRFIATTRFSVLLSSRNVICKFALSERKMETNYAEAQQDMGCDSCNHIVPVAYHATEPTKDLYMK